MGYFLVYDDGGYTQWRTLYPANVDSLASELDLILGAEKELRSLLIHRDKKVLPLRSYKYGVVVARELATIGY